MSQRITDLYRKGKLKIIFPECWANTTIKVLTPGTVIRFFLDSDCRLIVQHGAYFYPIALVLDQDEDDAKEKLSVDDLAVELLRYFATVLEIKLGENSEVLSFIVFEPVEVRPSVDLPEEKAPKSTPLTQRHGL